MTLLPNLTAVHVSIYMDAVCCENACLRHPGEVTSPFQDTHLLSQSGVNQSASRGGDGGNPHRHVENI